MDTEKEPVKVTPEKKSPAKSTVKVTNVMNQPYDLHLISLGLMFALSPRGQAGDTVELTEEQIAHPDFQSAKNYVVVTR